MDITTVAVAAIVTNGFVVLGWIALWFRHRARKGGDALQATQADQVERLTAEVRSLHATLDAVAIEVERLGEGQRYTARLLRERTDGASPQISAPPRVVTPH